MTTWWTSRCARWKACCCPVTPRPWISSPMGRSRRRPSPTRRTAPSPATPPSACSARASPISRRRCLVRPDQCIHRTGRAGRPALRAGKAGGSETAHPPSVHVAAGLQTRLIEGTCQWPRIFRPAIEHLEIDMRRLLLLSGLVATSVAAAAAPLRAHDFWIEPTGFKADLGRVVGVKLRVGDDFHGDPVPRNDDLIDRVRRRGRRRPPPGGGPRGRGPGGTAARHRAGPDDHRLSEPSEPGDAAGREVHAVPETGRAGRDRRGARAHADVRARGPRDLLALGQEPRAIGRGRRPAPAIARSAFPIELVAERNPYEMRRGETLPVRLTYRQAAAGRRPRGGVTTSARRTTS